MTDFIDYYTNKIKSNKYILIIEENIGSLLRSIPILQLLGVKDFTYPIGWRKISKKYKQFTPIPHEFVHIDQILEENKGSEQKYCMISKSRYGDYSFDYAIHKILISAKHDYLFVLNEQDACKKTLSGFVRPVKETELFHENYFTYYTEMYQRIVKTLKENYNWKLDFTQTQNLFLNNLAYIFNEIDNKKFDTVKELIIYAIKEEMNPIFYNIMEYINSLDREKVKNKGNIITAIARNFKYQFELNNEENKEITNLILRKYQDNDFESIYWEYKHPNKKSIVDEIVRIFNVLPEKIRKNLICPWKNLINHIS